MRFSLQASVVLLTIVSVSCKDNAGSELRGFEGSDCNSLAAEFARLNDKVLPEAVFNFERLFEEAKKEKDKAVDPNAQASNTGTGDANGQSQIAGTAGAAGAGSQENLAGGANAGGSEQFSTTPTGEEEFALTKQLALADGRADKLELPAVPVIAGGTVRITSLESCETIETSEVAKNECRGAARALAEMTKIASNYNALDRVPSCRAGAQANGVPVEYITCDNPCSFGEDVCTKCEFDLYQGDSRKTYYVVCSTESTAKSAIDNFCQTGTRCERGGCSTKVGAEFGDEVKSATGGTLQADSVDVSGFVGGYGKIDVTAGIKAETEVTAKVTATGSLRVALDNPSSPVFFANGTIQPGTSGVCEIRVTGVSNLEVKNKLGVFVGAEFFGNGVKADGGSTFGGSIGLGKEMKLTGPKFDAGGLSKDLVGKSCDAQLDGWLKYDLVNHIKEIGGLAIKLLEAKQGQADPLDGASGKFAGTQKGSSLYDTKDPTVGFHPYCQSADPGQRVRSGKSYIATSEASNDCNAAAELLWRGEQEFRSKGWSDKGDYQTACVHEIYRRCNSDWF